MTDRTIPRPEGRTPAPRSGGGGRSAPRHPGPPLGALAIFALLTLLGAIACGPLLGAGSLPSPFSSSSEVQQYFRESRAATAVGAWLLVLSALGLAFFSALVFSRLNFLAPHAPGPIIAGFGGVAASLSLAVSAVSTWVLSQPGVVLDAGWPQLPPSGSPVLVHAFHYLGFAAGGPLHVAALGVLVLGIAVTAYFLRRSPTWLSWLGVALAVVDVASTAALVTEAATPLVPIGRFLSMLWLVWMSLAIPRDRAARRR